jgi:putative ABC transport system permease protein
MIFLKIALLNIKKHLKRSLLVIFAVTISVVLLEFVSGMIDGLKSSFFDNMLRDTGHLQIHGQGYADRLNPYSLDYSIKKPDAIIKNIQTIPGILNAEKILKFGALVIKDDKNVLLEGFGVQESTVYLDKVKQSMVQGQFLPNGQGIAISIKIATLLKSELDDYINIVIEDKDGCPYYLDYKVSGIFETGYAHIDENQFFLSHANAEELLNFYDETIEIRIETADLNQVDSYKNQISRFVNGNEFTIQTWVDILGSLIIQLKMFDVFMIMTNFLVIIVVATVIMNTVLMNFFERIREFGTMRAIGLKKHQLFSLIITEGFVTGIFGGILGLMVGIAIVLYFKEYGLYVGDFMEAFKMSKSLHFSLSLQSTISNLVSGILIAIVGSIYAAGVSVKLRLIETLRFV